MKRIPTSLYLAMAVLGGNLDTGAAEGLPPGIPRTVNQDGSLFYIDPMFTSPRYESQALGELLREATSLASQLALQEHLPINASNLAHGFVCPFGYAFREKCIGNIATTNYWYFAKQGNKLTDVTRSDIDARCRQYALHYQWPLTRLDTNAACSLAARWLRAAQVDVDGLNRRYDVSVIVDPYWNNVRAGGIPSGTFCPIYIVSWLPKGVAQYSGGGGASVEMFLPTQTLLSLSVEDQTYNFRRVLTATNLAALFPGTASIKTNRTTEPIPFDPWR